jgi:hypothetical protein
MPRAFRTIFTTPWDSASTKGAFKNRSHALDINELAAFINERKLRIESEAC